MCGIVGYIAPEGYRGAVLDRKKFMRQGLLTDIVRGEDSTGIMFATKEATGDQLWHHKEACDPYDFVTGGVFQHVLSTDLTKAHFCVGHNRAATIGKVTKANAHPFVEDCYDGGAIALLHNGTLEDVTALPKLGPSRVEVDSHEICWNLAQVGPDGAKEVLESLYGAFVLIWADTRDSSLNIVRNDERPLHFLRGYGDVLYFASEALHLQWLATRLRLANNIEVFALEPGKWLKFTYGSVKPTVRDIKLNESLWANYRYAKPAGPGSYPPASGWSAPGTSRRPTGNGQSVAGIHSRGNERVHVGGNWRSFPDALIEAMDSVGLDPSDRFCVSPWSCEPGAEEKRYVATGWCNTLEMEVRCSRVLDYMAKPILEGATLLCRPIGVFFEKKDYPVVLAEIVHSSGQKYMESFKSPLVDPSASEEDSEDDIPDGIYTDEHGVTWYVGPYDASLTDAEWLRATEDGCAVCGEMMTIEDAEGTVWDTNYPICPSCVAAGNTDITSSWLARGGAI